MKPDDMKELIELVERSDIDEITYERITIRKKGSGAAAAEVIRNSFPSEDKFSRPRDTDSVPTAASDFHIVKSGMLGTFYSRPQMDAPAYVEIGQVIEANMVVCVIEAMKLFNEVRSEAGGEVVEVFAKDGDFVEYGTPLFQIRRG
jgi:acetyl-CoA carboxylase biotin carboxyl carrier protein